MSFAPAFWDRVTPVTLLLLPLSGLYAMVTGLRRLAYRMGLFKVQRFPVPVIVVGNISVGGTGKTPLVIWLVQHLKARGWRPGVVARGYGGKASKWPQQVRADSDPVTVGDEPVLIATRAACPVCVGPDRPQAVQALLDHTDCNIIVSDDGMQHYALGRDLEIAVIDPQRRFGNGLLLPAGPLREVKSRLNQADLWITQGEAGPGEHRMKLVKPQVIPLAGGSEAEAVELSRFSGQTVHAVAGIGQPARFFALLRDAGLLVIEHAFVDHHPFKAADLAFGDDLPVLMTDKDAVKCRPYGGAQHWVLRVVAAPDKAFVHRLDTRLQELIDG